MKSPQRPPLPALAWVAMVAAVAYLLACRSAFSPDSRKVLVPAWNPQTEQTCVFRYDRDRAIADCLLILPRYESNKDLHQVAVQWTPDGQRMLIAWCPDEDQLRLAQIPVSSRQPIRFHELELEEAMNSLIEPLPVVEPFVFLSGTSVTRLNLETGETLSPATTNSLRMFTDGTRLLYARQMPDESIEIGQMNPDSLKQQPLQLLPPQRAEDVAFFAFSASGKRLAVTRGEEEEQILDIYAQGKLEESQRLSSTNHVRTLGNLIWSRDEKILYAPCFQPVSGEDKMVRVGLCELGLDGQVQRETPVFTIKEFDGLPMMLQIALAPNGRIIALSNALDPDETVKPEQRALFLIDLSSTQRKVTRFALPFPAAPAAAKSKS